MAFQLDPSVFRSAPTVTDYLNQNRKMEQESRANEQAMAIGDEKIKAAKAARAAKMLSMATPENWQSIRSQAISEGLGSEDSVPRDYDPQVISRLQRTFGEMSSGTGFKVVGNQVVRLDESTGEVTPVYTAPSTAPTNPQTGLPERKLSATEQKELFDTTDLISSGEAAKGALTQAKDILTKSPKGAEPYTGFAAETRADIARVPLLGDIFADKERGAATTEYKTLVTEQALNNLKAIFGGMPTEGERQILMQMQALPSYTPQEQKRVIDNALNAADKRLEFNRRKAEAINTGSYSTMGRSLKDTVQSKQPSTGGAKFLGFE